MRGSFIFIPFLSKTIKTTSKWSLLFLFHVERKFYFYLRFHVEHLFSVCSVYLPNFTSRTFTSAGETPGIRDA